MSDAQLAAPPTGQSTSRIGVIMASAAPFDRLIATLASLAGQSVTPYEVIICRLGLTAAQAEKIAETVGSRPAHVTVMDARVAGAAPQRQQAFDASTAELLLFMDDDIDLDPDCVLHLEKTLLDGVRLGGVSACIRNQNYRPPGRIYRYLLRWLGFPSTGSLSGMFRGPVVHFLPDLNGGAAAVQHVEWLYLTCTMYRRAALPPVLFEGIVGQYALMEDVALSLRVAERHGLAACRRATIFHDTKPQEYKSNASRRQHMEIQNRIYILRHILKRFGAVEHLQLLLLSAIFTLTVWRLPGRNRDKLAHVVARWRHHLAIYLPAAR